jgi:hypothetical protein
MPTAFVTSRTGQTMIDKDNEGPPNETDPTEKARDQSIEKEEVGYGKPPKHSQFKKGTSGNKAGRPPGAKNKPPAHDDLLTLLQEEGARIVRVTQNGKTEDIQTIRLVTRRLMTAAASGDARAQKIVLTVQTTLQERKQDRNSAAFAAVFEYKNFCQKRIADAKKAGEPEPRFSPHPDSFDIDFDTNEVRSLELDPDGNEYISLVMDLLAFYQSCISETIKCGCAPEDFELYMDDLRSDFLQMTRLMRLLELPWCYNRYHRPDMQRFAELHQKLGSKYKRNKSSKKRGAQ